MHRWQVFDQIHARLLTCPDPQLDQARDDLTAIAPQFRQVIQRMMDARRGHPASAGGNSSGTGTSTSPTERALGLVLGDETTDEQGPKIPPRDPAGAAIARLDEHLRRLYGLSRILAAQNDPGYVKQVNHHARGLWRIVTAWTPHAPTSSDKRHVERQNRPDGTDWCEHHRAAGHAEPTAHVGTVSGNLDLPMALCSFCYWQVRRKGKLPNGDAIDKHARTGKQQQEYAT